MMGGRARTKDKGHASGGRRNQREDARKTAAGAAGERRSPHVPFPTRVARIVAALNRRNAFSDSEAMSIDELADETHLDSRDVGPACVGIYIGRFVVRETVARGCCVRAYFLADAKAITRKADVARSAAKRLTEQAADLDGLAIRLTKTTKQVDAWPKDLSEAGAAE